MRSKIKGVVAFFLIALLTIPLALVGVENLFYGGNNTGEAAEVNGTVISERDVQLAIGRERQQLQSQFGDSLPADFLSNERLRVPALDRLVQRSLLSDVAKDGKMTLSDKQIDEIIVGLPDFQVDGAFDSQRFVQGVRNIGHTPTTFRELLREDLTVNQLQTALLSSDFITADEIQRSVALSRQTRDFSWLRLPLGDLTEKALVSDEEIQAHYDANKQSYLTEEQVAVEYIELDTQTLEKDITVDEETVRQQYDQEVAAFQNTITREAAHIMVEGDDDAAQQKIASIQQKLAEGDDFAAIATEFSDDFGSKDNGGNLGSSTGDAFPDEFESTLKQLSEGQVSEPVQIDNATHFIKLIAAKEQTAPSFEQEKSRIISELKRVRVEEQFIEDVEALGELAYNAENLQEVGEQLGLPVGKTELFSRTDSKDQSILQDSRVVNAAFSERVLQEGFTSEVLELSQDKVVVLNLIDKKPVRTLSLDEKRDDIVQQLKLDKAKAELAQQAEALINAQKGGADLAALGEEKGLEVATQIAAQRNNSAVPAELLSHIFSMPAPKDQLSTSGIHLDNGDYAVVSLAKVSDGTIASLTDEERDSLDVNLAANKGRDAYQAWQSLLRAEADVDIFKSQNADY